MKISKQVKGDKVLLAIEGNEAEQSGFIDMLQNWGVTRKQASHLESDGVRLYLWCEEKKVISGLTNKVICNLPDATLSQFKTKRYGAWELAKTIALDQFNSWPNELLAFSNIANLASR